MLQRLLSPLAFFFFLSLALACKSHPEGESETVPGLSAPPSLAYQLVKVYPHDTSSYTQGLVWENGALLEGSGEYGKSKLSRIDLASGKALQSVGLPATDFGEGITQFKDKIYQLTWQEHKIHVYDAKTFRLLQTKDWPYEGWGITHNGEQLIISTGGSNLYFVHPELLTIQRTIGVNDNNGYVDSINELEFANGYVYANRYMTDWVLKINPKDGAVVGRFDASQLLRETNAAYDPRNLDAGYVLNGIAFNKTNGHFYLTGKKWPILAEVVFP